MPFYHALVRPDLLTEPQRQQFAGHVVDVHCDVTAHPRRSSTSSSPRTTTNNSPSHKQLS